MPALHAAVGRLPAGPGVTMVAMAQDDPYCTLGVSRQASPDENRKAFTKVEEQAVTGVPSATCLTYPIYESSNSKVTWCAVAVGRYTAEFSSSQRQQALQGIGAAYLVLKNNS